jgi:hypothetical protein
MSEEMLNIALDQFRATARQLTEQETVSDINYYQICRDATVLRANHPELGEQIAYEMVSAGSKVDEENNRVEELKSLFYDLDVPEAHVDTDHGMSVEDRWNRIAELSKES